VVRVFGLSCLAYSMIFKNAVATPRNSAMTRSWALKKVGL
jgi:hypothetical protein